MCFNVCAVVNQSIVDAFRDGFAYQAVLGAAALFLVLFFAARWIVNAVR